MNTHKVCVITCPNCHHEKTLKRVDERCVVHFQCKNCQFQSLARMNQECFEFEGIVPINA